jgi:hypothetical protein
MWYRVLVERACVKVMVLPAPTSPPELKTETELLTWITKQNCQTELPNQIIKQNCQTELSN